MFEALVPNQIITGNGTVYERSLGETQFRRLPGKAWIGNYHSIREMQDEYDRAMHGSPKFRPNYVRYYDFDSMSKAWNEEFAAWAEDRTYTDDQGYTYDRIRYDESAPIPEDSWPAEEIQESEHEIRETQEFGADLKRVVRLRILMGHKRKRPVQQASEYG